MLQLQLVANSEEANEAELAGHENLSLLVPGQ